MRDEYWDFILSPDKTPIDFKKGLTEKCLISYINIDKDECVGENNKLYSLPKYIWPEAKNNNVELLDIGLTGIDNGLISFKTDRISNEEYYKILTESKIKLENDDLRLFLTPITGNTQQYAYPYEIHKSDEEGKYAILKGGFFQGYYKLYGFDYETLPTFIEDSWSLEFVLRKKDYEVDSKTLNYKHPNNKGIFFYLGTRAENKFYQFYKSNIDQYENNTNLDYSDSEYFQESGYKFDRNKIIDSNYFGEDNEPDKPIISKGYFADKEEGYINDKDCQLQSSYDFTLDDYVIWDDGTTSHTPTICKTNDNDLEKSNSSYSFNSTKKSVIVENKKKDIENIVEGCSCGEGMKITITKASFPNPYYKLPFNTSSCTAKKAPQVICNNINRCKCDSYYADSYYNEYNNPCCDTIGYLAESDYFMPDVSLKDVFIETTNEHPFNKTGYYEFESDNKFLLFNRTSTGFTANNYVDGLTVTFTGRTNTFKGNYFLLMNRAKTGYTASTIDKLLKEYEDEYDINKDIINNAFALRINDDNAIGYRYLLKDCNVDKEYEVVEEYSKPNIITAGKWHTINVRIKVITGLLNTCKKPINRRKIKLYFYVDGNLVFISKELPEFFFKELNDTYDKQEAVPYNISLGGGTQGLCDTMWLNMYEFPTKILPLEKHFGGTFLGDIKSFKFYNCPLNYNEIKNNYKYEELKERK